jgi:hypothetical protein
MLRGPFLQAVAKRLYFKSSFLVYTGGPIQWDLVYSVTAQAFHNSAMEGET